MDKTTKTIRHKIRHTNHKYIEYIEEVATEIKVYNSSKKSSEKA